jgi:hypothetical protein
MSFQFEDGIPDGFREMLCQCGRRWITMCFKVSKYLECPDCHRMVLIDSQKLFTNNNQNNQKELI